MLRALRQHSSLGTQVLAYDFTPVEAGSTVLLCTYLLQAHKGNRPRRRKGDAAGPAFTSGTAPYRSGGRSHDRPQFLE